MPFSLGDAYKTARFLVDVRTRWNLADWERRLRQRDDALAAQWAAADAIFTRDQMIQAKPQLGVELVVRSPEVAAWASHDRLTFTARVLVRNQWGSPFLVDRVTGTFAYQGFTGVEFPVYADRFTVRPFEAHSFERSCAWMPVGDQLQSAGITADRQSVARVMVTPNVYCIAEDRREFTVTGQLELWLNVQPRPTQ